MSTPMPLSLFRYATTLKYPVVAVVAFTVLMSLISPAPHASAQAENQLLPGGCWTTSDYAYYYFSDNISNYLLVEKSTWYPIPITATSQQVSEPIWVAETDYFAYWGYYDIYVEPVACPVGYYPVFTAAFGSVVYWYLDGTTLWIQLDQGWVTSDEFAEIISLETQRQQQQAANQAATTSRPTGTACLSPANWAACGLNEDDPALAPGGQLDQINAHLSSARNAWLRPACASSYNGC